MTQTAATKARNANLARGFRNEADFQRHVIRLAQDCGWLICAFRPCPIRAGKIATPVQGNPGYVDVTLVHPKGYGPHFWEFKMPGMYPQPDQRTWHAALDKALLELGGPWPDDRSRASVRVFRPADLDTITELLTMPLLESHHAR